MSTIKAKQGQRLTFTLSVNDTAGAPVDLTGFTANLKITSRDRQANIAELTSAAGDIVLGDTDPNVQITINTAVTDAWDFDIGYGDLELTRTADGEVIYSINLLFDLEKSFNQ